MRLLIVGSMAALLMAGCCEDSVAKIGLECRAYASTVLAGTDHEREKSPYWQYVVRDCQTYRLAKESK